jgi:hypothetical protein
MFSTFIGACLMGVGLSLNIRSGLELPSDEEFHSDIFGQTEA